MLPARDMALDGELVTALAGRYDIERELGRGGMAVVYLAHDRKHSRDVALKVLHPELASAVGAERFQREVAFAAPLVHPNILPVHDSGEAAGSLYYVMPYVEGSTLRERIEREGQLPIEDAIAIARQVALAIDHAHAHGVLHRDIKPDNILLHGEHVLVADFGLARAITAVSSARLTGAMVVGTPAYMSPEQCTPGGMMDGRSDIYSLACVVFEMIAGQPPFEGSTAEILLGHHLVSDPPSLCKERRSCPSQLDAAVRRALAKVPADRFRTAGAFVEAMTRPGSLRVQAWRTRAREWRLPLAALAAMVLLLGGWLLSRERTWPSATPALSARSPSADGGEAVPERARRIAVLYFDDLSHDRRLSYLAAGLTEALIDRLSQVPGLHVISPNGMRSVRDSAMSLDSIAHRLNVGTLVGGSLLDSGDSLRLTVRLIDGANGEQLSSHSIALPTAEFVRLQDSLATEVAIALREHLGREVQLREERSTTASLPAWEAAQRGHALVGQARAAMLSDAGRTVSLLARADSLFLRAERLDREWAGPPLYRAQDALLLVYAKAGGTRPGSKDPELDAALQRAIGLADSVLAAHPGDPRALAVRGEARLRLAMLDPSPRRLAFRRAARADLESAVGARPDLARAWNALGDLAMDENRFEDAYQAYRTSYETDAFLTDIRAVLNGLFFASLYAGRFPEARRWCATSLARFPGDPRFSDCTLTVLGWSGSSRAEVANGWTTLRRAEAADTLGMLAFNAFNRRMMIAAVLARAGLPDSARAVIDRAHHELGNRSTAPVAEAYVHLLLGERRQATGMLAAYVTAMPAARAGIAHLPWFATLRTDPAFMTLVSGSSQ